MQRKMLSLCHGYCSQDWQGSRLAVHVERADRLPGSIRRVGGLSPKPTHCSIPCQAHYRPLVREPRPPAVHPVAWDVA